MALVRRCVPLGLMVILALATVGAAPRPEPRASGLSAGERLERLMERVKLEQEQLRTLQADFSQHKESLLLAAPEEARGRFVYAHPDRVLWEYAEPTPTRVVIRGEEMVTWYEDLGRAERVHIGQYSNQIFKYLGASNSLGALQKYFTVRVAFPEDPALPYRLELEPRYERVAKRLAGMVIWLDPQLYLPSRLRYEEADGDLTEYRFEHLVVNEELPSEAFDLDLPEDVEVRTVELDRGP